MPHARELEAYALSFSVSSFTEKRLLTLSRRLIYLTFTLVIIDVITFLLYSDFARNMGYSTIGGLTASLLLPVCGLFGVKMQERLCLCCFWSWSLVFFIFHLLTAVLFISWISNGFSWILFIPVTSNVLGASFLWLSFLWGKRLHDGSRTWDTPQDIDDYIDECVSVDVHIPSEAIIIGETGEIGASDLIPPSVVIPEAIPSHDTPEDEEKRENDEQLSHIRRHWAPET